MLVLKPGQPELLAQTFKDVANIAAGAMVFGQALSQGDFSMRLALGGIGLWIGLITLAIMLAGVRKP